VSVGLSFRPGKGVLVQRCVLFILFYVTLREHYAKRRLAVCCLYFFDYSRPLLLSN
jgi:hypothetical protein